MIFICKNISLDKCSNFIFIITQNFNSWALKIVMVPLLSAGRTLKSPLNNSQSLE